MTFDAYGGDDVTAVLAAYHAPLVYALPHLIKPLVHTKLQLDTVRVCASARLQIRSLMHILKPGVAPVNGSYRAKWVKARVSLDIRTQRFHGVRSVFMAAMRGGENKFYAVSAFLLLITLFVLSADGRQAQSARSADDYFNQGLFQYHRGNLNGASADFSRAIAINPQLALAYYYRGTIRAIRGNWDAAIADYSKEIDIDPTHALAYYNRGVARFAKWDLDGALADFNASLTINPDHPEAYYNRGVIRQAKADLNSAINDSDIALKINPHYPEAYNNRGAARQETGDLNGAVSDFNQAIKFDPRYAEAYANRGMAFLLEGNERAAEHDFERALRLNKTLKAVLRERIKKTNTLPAAKQPGAANQ